MHLGQDTCAPDEGVQSQVDDQQHQQWQPVGLSDAIKVVIVCECLNAALAGEAVDLIAANVAPIKARVHPKAKCTVRSNSPGQHTCTHRSQQ